MRWLVFWSVLLGSCASDDAGLVRVDVRTDWVPGVEFTEIDIEILDGPRTRVPVSLGEDFILGVRVASLDAEYGQRELRATLLQADGRRVADRRLELRHEGGNTQVTVTFSRTCANVSCPGDDPAATECVSGRCVPPSCSPETPELCGEGGCTSNAECPAPEADCVVGVCSEGECFAAPVEDFCSAGQFCDPELGCTALPTPDDAGVADAGSSDAASSDAASSDAGSSDAGLPDAGPCATIPCLVLYYEFEDSPGSLARDSSGFRNDASLVGEAARHVPGARGEGWEFDQFVDEYAVSGIGANLGLDQRYTLAFWVNMSRQPEPGAPHGIFALVDDDERPLVTVVSTERDTGHYELTGTGDTFLVPHRPGEGWRHIALVAGDGPRGALVYLDGERVEQGGSWRDSPTAPTGLLLGGKFAGSVTGGISAIDDLRIYRGRLSREQVAELAAR